VFSSGITVDRSSLGHQGCQRHYPTSWEVAGTTAKLPEVLGDREIRSGDFLVKHVALVPE
jgi:hypothetical protein